MRFRTWFFLAVVVVVVAGCGGFWLPGGRRGAAAPRRPQSRRGTPRTGNWLAPGGRPPVCVHRPPAGGRPASARLRGARATAHPPAPRQRSSSGRSLDTRGHAQGAAAASAIPAPRRRPVLVVVRRLQRFDGSLDGRPCGPCPGHFWGQHVDRLPQRARRAVVGVCWPGRVRRGDAGAVRRERRGTGAPRPVAREAVGALWGRSLRSRYPVACGAPGGGCTLAW